MILSSFSVCLTSLSVTISVYPCHCKWHYVNHFYDWAWETISKTERQPSEWKKIFGNEATKQRLISKIHNQHVQLNIKKNKQPNQKEKKKWMEDLNRHFSKEDIYMAKKHVEKCLTWFIIRKMQIKTSMSHHLTQVRKASIQQIYKQYFLERVWRKGNPPTLLLEI